MADPSTKGTSTFAVARQVVNWAREIDPTIFIQDDDVMPLCVGPMRKVLAFSMSNFRSKRDIAFASKTLALANKKTKSADRLRMNEERSLIQLEIRDALKKQKVVRQQLSDAVERLRKSESTLVNLRDDYDAFEMRERVTLELSLARSKELEVWARTIQELSDTSQIQTAEATVSELQKECAYVLRDTNKDAVLMQTAALLEGVADELAIPTGTLLRKQTESELHTSVISEYLAAARMSHEAAEKLSDKVEVVCTPDDKDIFLAALALELATVEKSTLKKIIAEVESSVTAMSAAPSELETQKVAAKNLRERTALLKRKIASQARQNLSLDRSLQEMSASYLQGTEDNTDMDMSVDYSLPDASFSRVDFPSNASTGVGDMTGLRDHTVAGGHLSLGSQLDCHVEELGRALSNLSGCWIHQSEALAATTVQSLRRIVPDTASVSSSLQAPSIPPSSSLLDSLVGLGGESAFQLPLPVEDFTSRQASDTLSSFRVLTAKLSVPSSLSASASIRTVAAMRSQRHPDRGIFHTRNDSISGVSSVVGEGVPAPSLLGRVGSVRATEAAAILSHAVEGLRDTVGGMGRAVGGVTGGVGGQGALTGQPTGQLNMEQVESLVSSLTDTADRLQSCFNSAQTLRRSLRSLGEEEKMTHVALRDYNDQPARTLLSPVRTLLSPV